MQEPISTEQDKIKKLSITIALFACSVFVAGIVHAQESEGEFVQQSEAEFQKLVPVTGTVKTFFGDFELDHSFPQEGEADRIYDILDHQRASQLYLWGLPIVAMTRWHQGYVDALENYDYQTLVHASTYVPILTSNQAREQLNNR